jgi:hypothetical protein
MRVFKNDTWNDRNRCWVSRWLHMSWTSTASKYLRLKIVDLWRSYNRHSQGAYDQPRSCIQLVLFPALCRCCEFAASLMLSLDIILDLTCCTIAVPRWGKCPTVLQHMGVGPTWPTVFPAVTGPPDCWHPHRAPISHHLSYCHNTETQDLHHARRCTF